MWGPPLLLPTPDFMATAGEEYGDGVRFLLFLFISFGASTISWDRRSRRAKGELATSATAFFFFFFFCFIITRVRPI